MDKVTIVVMIVIKSKFEFRNNLILLPNIVIIIPISIKRKERPISDAIINCFKFKFSIPALNVKTL